MSNNLNDLHLMMGQALEGINNLKESVDGIKQRLDDNIEPVLDDYRTTKKQVLAVSAVLSTLFGGMSAIFMGMFKH